jgi:hypothetical protein
MNKLETRLSKLEHKSSVSSVDFIMLVELVTAGEERELSEIHTANGELAWKRSDGESQDEFVARAEQEAKEVIQPQAKSAILLIGSSA